MSFDSAYRTAFYTLGSASSYVTTMLAMWRIWVIKSCTIREMWMGVTRNALKTTSFSTCIYNFAVCHTCTCMFHSACTCIRMISWRNILSLTFSRWHCGNNLTIKCFCAGTELITHKHLTYLSKITCKMALLGSSTKIYGHNSRLACHAGEECAEYA